MARRSFLRFYDLNKFQIFIYNCKLTTFIFTHCFYILLQITQSHGKITEKTWTTVARLISFNLNELLWNIQLNMEIGQPDFCMAMQNRRSVLFTRGTNISYDPQALNLGSQVGPKVPTALPWNQTGTPDVSHWLRPRIIGYNCSNFWNCSLASK